MSTPAPKLESLTIFFPFFNDAGTVSSQIKKAFQVGQKVANELEVIAIHGGNSLDSTATELAAAKNKFPTLKVIDKRQNRVGYAVIQEGFKAATSKWVFYTDGDAQYDVNDLISLVKKQAQTQADVVNGYKSNRKDNVIRQTLGWIFQFLYKTLTKSPIADIHCDFRLIRRSLIQNYQWRSSGANIISELIQTLQQHEAAFAEIPVRHYARSYGHSNYSWWQLLLESLKELLWKLRQA